MEAAVRVEALTKRFSARDRATAPTFRAWVEGLAQRRAVPRDVVALDRVDLTVGRGEMVGVIGRNGSGKSTLLRLVGGVLAPDGGTIRRRGSLRGILELNAGMHPDLTGRENILIAGVLSGLLRREVAARMAEIIAFSELGAQIDSPVRTYSSGMKLRLGFAVAVHVDPEILLIDEVLAVGDMAFQEKCLARIAAFRRQGCAILLISHDMGQVRRNCDRVVWLDRGRVQMEGRAERVVQAYERAAHMAFAEMPEEPGPALRARRHGRGGARIEAVALTDASGRPVSDLVQGGALHVAFRLVRPSALPVEVSVSLTDAAGRLAFDANSATDRLALGAGPGEQALNLRFERLDLAPGRYFLSVGAWAADWSAAEDVHEDGWEIEVTGGPTLQGLLAPPRSWSIAPAT